MVLSDFGAQVIRFSDPLYRELDRQPSARMWLRGKETATRPLHELLRRADVLVISKPHGFSGCDYELVHRINKTLVYAEVTAMPGYENLPVSEPVVAAKLGRMQSLAGISAESGPRYCAVPVATHAAAQNLVAGILAALYERNRSGLGQKVATSLAHGLAAYDYGSLAMQLHGERTARQNSSGVHAVPSGLSIQAVQCADGKWLQLGNLLPHLFEHFMKAIGLEAELSALDGREEEVRDAILTRMATKTADQWMALFDADGSVAAHPYQTAAEALRDPDMVLNHHVLEHDGFQQLGPLARLSHTPAEIGKSPEGDRWLLPVAQSIPDISAPLLGVTVLEFAGVIAAPLAASLLADLGARVIKVEPPGGDPYRHIGSGYGAICYNRAKQSIGIDLKSAAGQRIVEKLVRSADIVIHNYRPGVPERLGIGYEQLRAIKPDIIYLSASGYGPDGPGASRPASHSIAGAALGGALYQTGTVPQTLLPLPARRDIARRLNRANDMSPDPGTALVIRSSALLALLARERTGMGQQVMTDMFIATAYANFDGFVDDAHSPTRAPLDEQLLGVGALKHLYRCETGWVVLDIERLADWETFCRIVSATHLLSHYPDPFNHPHEHELIEELAALFRNFSADHWESRLLPRGIACAVADGPTLSQFFYAQCHPHSDWMAEVKHRDLGRYYRHKPMIEFSRSRLWARGTVMAGEDTRRLMDALGYDDAAVEAMLDEGILWAAA